MTEKDYFDEFIEIEVEKPESPCWLPHLWGKRVLHCELPEGHGPQHLAEGFWWYEPV